MSQLIFPSFPGVAWPVTRTMVAPPVTIKTTPSNREFRFRFSRVARYKISVAFEFLRESQGFHEYQQLRAFFGRVGGTFDDWLFDDVTDNHASNELFAVGDGVTTTFQFARSIGGLLEPVYGLNGAPIVTANGAQVQPRAISDAGAVSFNQAPAAGVQLRWTGDFFWRCRFTSDSLEFTQNYRTFMEAKKVEFITTVPL